MKDTHQLIERYLASWNETHALRRRALIEEVYAEHAVYTDPMVQAKGWDAIDAAVATVQKMFPDHVFQFEGPIDAHHDTARFTWHLAAPGVGEPLVIGFDVAALKDGRIHSVYGFLDKVPMAV